MPSIQTETHTETHTDPQKRFLCRHIHASGFRCGSPSLRGESFCYYHHASRRPMAAAAARPAEATFVFPPLEDRTSIQVAITEVLRALAANQIDARRAALLLYGFQIASSNLPREQQPKQQPDRFTGRIMRSRFSEVEPDPVPMPVEAFLADPDLGALAPIAEAPEPASANRRATPAELMDYLAQDPHLYDWKGNLRKVPIPKGGNIPAINGEAETFEPPQPQLTAYSSHAYSSRLSAKPGGPIHRALASQSDSTMEKRSTRPAALSEPCTLRPEP